jgi:hypothetical protein
VVQCDVDHELLARLDGELTSRVRWHTLAFSPIQDHSQGATLESFDVCAVRESSDDRPGSRGLIVN